MFPYGYSLTDPALPPLNPLLHCNFRREYYLILWALGLAEDCLASTHMCGQTPERLSVMYATMFQAWRDLSRRGPQIVHSLAQRSLELDTKVSRLFVAILTHRRALASNDERSKVSGKVSLKYTILGGMLLKC